MKKMTAIVLSLILVAASIVVLTSCNKKENENNGGEEIVGAYTAAESPVITDAFKQVFDKATAELDGVAYTPVAYLASQVVAGTNHRVLCKAQVVVPDAVPTYAILTIYEDLQGNAEVTDIINTAADANYPEGLSGGWSEVADLAVTDEAKTALEKATETLTGAEYKPVALLATQVVAGTNYRILCESKATVPNAETGYVIVTVYADLQGNAEITDTVEFVNETPEAEAADTTEAPTATIGE